MTPVVIFNSYEQAYSYYDYVERSSLMHRVRNDGYEVKFDYLNSRLVGYVEFEDDADAIAFKLQYL